MLRENFINRVYTQMTGYWAHNLDGMDYLSDSDYAVLLSSYLGLSEDRITAIIREMMNRGDYTLAARAASWGLRNHPNSSELEALRRSAYIKLSEKYQFTNPFKVIIYSEKSGHEIPQLELPR